MIHEGVPVPALEPMSKKAPTHSPVLICVKTKSAGLIVQLFPPNDIETVTSVLQAVGARDMVSDGILRVQERTYGIGSSQSIGPCPGKNWVFVRKWL